MNETDISNLSYKELQALAVRYRVPGNIKKHQLVRVLQAVQSGNESEVSKILAELQQTRKKRIKKVKRDTINVIPTPIHSPAYAMSDDYYYPQPHPPYQWIGAEEEISSREDEALRFPNYDEFQQFLLRRIQREYSPYAMQDNDLAQIPSIVDLRMGAGSSIVRSMPTEVGRTKVNVTADPAGYDPSPLVKGERRTIKDTNGNNQIPILLKKMLEAPVGANLGQIASPEAESYQIASLEQRPNNGGDPMDDSDTLTAESDEENDDLWDCANAASNNRSFYFVANNGDPMSINQAQLRDKIAQDVGQLPSSVASDQYAGTPPVSVVQANCQKWIATNSFVGRDANYAATLDDNSRSYNHVYYDNSTLSARTTKSRNIEQNYQSNGASESINYEANQSGLHGQPINEAYQYFQINSETTDSTVNPNDAYYTQQTAKRIGDAEQKCFGHGSGDNSHVNIVHGDNQAAAQGAPVAQLAGNAYGRETGDLFDNPLESNGFQYNMGYYPQYGNEDNQALAGYTNAAQQQQFLYQQHQQQEQQQYQQQQQQQQQQQHQQHSQLQQYQQQTQHHEYQQQQQQQANVPAAQNLANRRSFEEPATSQRITNGTLDSFWPRWPINSTVTSCGQLEPILNLLNYNSFDYARLDSEACVYCYKAPVITQRRIETPNPSCTQKKRLRTECRQHSFRPNPLVYNDSSTGMRMAEITKISVPKACPQESPNDGPSISSMDLDSENMASPESSDDSINDVWMCTRYPTSSDYAPQSSGLIIDENENDLLSL